MLTFADIEIVVYDIAEFKDEQKVVKMLEIEKPVVKEKSDVSEDDFMPEVDDDHVRVKPKANKLGAQVSYLKKPYS